MQKMKINEEDLQQDSLVQSIDSIGLILCERILA